MTRVRALAMPVNTKQYTPSTGNKGSSQSRQPPSALTKSKKQRLVVGEKETTVHNSFYMPSSTWNDILLVESSSPPTVTEIGPVCIDKYGM
jgi:hypothetical protein